MARAHAAVVLAVVLAASGCARGLWAPTTSRSLPASRDWGAWRLRSTTMNARSHFWNVG